MSRPLYEVADVIGRFGQEFNQQAQPNGYQKKVLRTLMQCRTAALGYHKDRCDDCGHERISYNSCGNRHCPKCQGVYQAFWIEELMAMILPVKHYHMVFTVPHELNAIAMVDSRWFYNMLFAKTWETLQAFGYTHYGVESGALMVLHTWGQNLSFHPHVHCIVSAAGQTPAGNMKHIGHSGKYLFPVRAVSAAFKGKMMESIKRWLTKKGLWEKHKTQANAAWNRDWNVHCEPSLGNPEHVVRYLGQYTHRVAIANHRILKVDDAGVTFLHKDYRDNAQQKPAHLTGVEFLRRFCQHFLPLRFVKIRYYGIYSSRFRALQQKDNPKMRLKPKNETAAQRILRLTGVDVCRCPVCKKGMMRTIEVVPRIRSPAFEHKYIRALKIAL